jgi:hypothetical protein
MVSDTEDNDSALGSPRMTRNDIAFSASSVMWQLGMDMKASKTVNGDIVCDGNRGGRQLMAPSKHQYYRESKMQRNEHLRGRREWRQTA